MAGHRIALTNMTLREIIARSSGWGGGWAAFDRPNLVKFKLAGQQPLRFDVLIRTSAPVTEERGQQLLREVVVERFKLRTRTETRQLPIYALTVARPGRLGPHLAPSPHDCSAFVAAGGTRQSQDQPRRHRTR